MTSHADNCECSVEDGYGKDCCPCKPLPDKKASRGWLGGGNLRHVPKPDKKKEPKPAGDRREEYENLPLPIPINLVLPKGWGEQVDAIIKAFISRVESSALSRGREQGIREALGVVPEDEKWGHEIHNPDCKATKMCFSCTTIWYRNQGKELTRQAILNLLPKE